MIGKIIGAMAGAKVAEHTRGLGGGTGALLGAVAVPVGRRMGPMGCIAAAARGFAFKRYNDKRKAREAAARPGPV